MAILFSNPLIITLTVWVTAALLILLVFRHLQNKKLGKRLSITLVVLVLIGTIFYLDVFSLCPLYKTEKSCKNHDQCRFIKEPFGSFGDYGFGGCEYISIKERLELEKKRLDCNIDYHYWKNGLVHGGCDIYDWILKSKLRR